MGERNMANNSVGSVSIDLDAKIANFVSDLGRAARVAEQRAKEIRESLGSVLEVIGVGVSIAGITEFIRSSIDAQDAISKLSQKVGVSTETLSGWELASKQAGVETDSLQKGLIKLGQAAAASADGSKEQVNAFKSIGVSATDASGHLKPIETLFGQVADKISSYKDSTEKTVVATRLFGKSGADLIPLLNGGSKGLAEYIKLADDFGLIVGSKSAKAAEDFNDRLEQLGFVSKGVANQLATALSPALADLAQEAVGFFRGNQWKAVLGDISDGAKAVADHVNDIINAAKLLGEIVATVYAGKIINAGLDWIANLTAQGVAVDSLGAKTQLSLLQTVKNIGLLSTSLNLLGAAVVGWQIGTYLYNQFAIVRDAGAIAVGTILVGWTKLQEGAQLAWLAIEDSWAEALGRMRSVFNTFGTGIATVLQHSLLPSVRQAGDQMAAELSKSAQGNATQLEANLTKNALARMKIREDANKKIADIQSNTWSGVGIKNAPTSDHALDGMKAATDQKKSLGLISSAVDENKKAYDAAVQAIQGKIAADQESLNVGIKVTQAEKDRASLIQKMDSGTLKVTSSQRAYLLSLSNTDIELQKSIALDKEKAVGISNILSLTQKLSSGLQDQSDQNAINNLAISHGSEVTQRLQGELEIRQKYQREIDQLNRTASRPENVGTTNGIGGDAYNTQLAEIAGFQKESTALYQQGVDDRTKLEANGMNGVRAAMEDFMSTQQNAAQQTKEFTTNALSGFSDAFAQFASGAESGKKAFGSFIDSMYQQALKFLANKSIQALFDSFNTSGNGNTSGSVAGGFGSILGNLSNAFGFGGGHASGGSVDPGKFYQVNERGPELFTYNNADYLLAGSKTGKVTPITSATSRQGGGNTFVTNVSVQPTSTRRTADQVAQEVARKQRVATARSA